MQKWLKDKTNPFDGQMKKTELYEIIKLKKPEAVYKTDEFLCGKGHDVLHLPHTIVNLTLSKWYGGDVKGYLGRENNTFKTNDVKDLIIKGFKTMTVRVKLLICTGQNKQRFQVILISIINLYAHKGMGSLHVL